MSQLQSKNAVVLGISTDTVESHKRFAEKEHLNFPLLADADKAMVTAYGVLGQNGFANRVTFVIGEDGKILAIDRAVNGQFAREGTTLRTRHGSNLALLLSDWKAAVGQPVPNFSVADTQGKTVSLFALGKKATVVLFLSARSPEAHAYDARIRQIASDPDYKDVAFLGLYPNANETPTDIKAAAEQAMFGFPVGKDANNKLADHFQATVTPTVWVVDAKGIVVYSGALDDNPDPGKVRTFYLKEALDAVLADKPVGKGETKAVGSPIKRVRRTNKP